MQHQQYRTELFYSEKETRPLSREDEQDLIRRAQSGDEDARAEFLTRNVRFVVSIAQSFLTPESPFTLDELVSEGNVGLITALDRFDDRGHKFITYAVWWIRKAIIYSFERDLCVVRRPFGHKKTRSDLKKHTLKLTEGLGRAPTYEELSESSGVALKRVKDVILSTSDDISLDGPVAGDEFNNRTTLGDMILVDHEVADEMIQRLELRSVLKGCIAILDNREQLIIRSYFGLNGDKPLTLAGIATIVGITRERVRQIRNESLEKMRKHIELRDA